MTDSQREAQLQVWLDEHRRLLFKVVRAYTVDAADQDDLFQDICMQLWRSVASFKGNARASTWIYRIALNTAISWERKSISNKKLVDDPAYREYLLIETKEGMDERLIWLYDEIRLLNRIERSLILLQLDGYSYQEMADITGLSISNLGVKLNRIKKRLAIRAQKINYHGIQ